MSFINAGGKPNSEHYLLGGGALYVYALDSAGVFPTYGEHVGTVDEMSFTVETTTVEHKSALTGLRVTDKECPAETKVSGTLTLSQVDAANLSRFLFGEYAEDHANDIQSSAVTGSSNVTIYKQGAWYDLYAANDGLASVTQDSSGERIYDLGAVTVAGSVEGTDFEVDLVNGRIFIVDGGNLGAAATLTVPVVINVNVALNASADANIEEVRALTQTSQEVALKFISIDACSGAQTEYQVHKANLIPNGDLALIGDEFAKMGFSFTVSSNPTADPDSPYVTVRKVAGQ